MYVLMEKISRDAMRVDVPVVNPAGIDGTYIVKVRSSAALWRRRLCLGRSSTVSEESTEGDGPAQMALGHLYGDRRREVAFSPSCKRAACGPDH